MKTIIRKAKQEDIPQVIKLFRGIVQYHHDLDPVYLPGSKLPRDSAKRITKLIRKRNAVLIIAEVNRRIVGYFIAEIKKSRMRVNNKIGWISDGFVEKKFRRKDLGKDLFAFTKKWFLRKGFKRIELMVDTRNTLGIKAWQKYGFKEYQKKMYTVI